MHCNQAVTLYELEHARDLVYLMGQDMGITALVCSAETLWYLGYPDQAVAHTRRAISLSQSLAHPFSLVTALGHAAFVHLFRRDGQNAQAQAETSLALVHEHGFAQWLAYGTCIQTD